MSISVTDIGSTSTNTFSSSASLTWTPGVAVPAGSTIVLVFSSPATGLSFSDSAGNNYTSIGQITVTGTALILYAYECQGCLALTTSSTITFSTTDATSTSICVDGLYLTGAGALDTNVTNTATVAAAVVTVTSGSPVVANELFIAAEVSTKLGSFTQSTGWSSPPDNPAAASANNLIGGNQLNTGTGTLAYSPTYSASGGASAAIIFAFEPGGIVGLFNMPMLGM